METPVYFISDIHLMLNLTPTEKERQERLFRFFRHVRDTGGTLFINGDLFDFYFEYKHLIPKNYFNFYYQLYKLKNSGVNVHFILGNHDWWVLDFIINTLTTKTYFDDVSININGKKFYITHGDGYLSWDSGYRLLRSIIRSRLFTWGYRWIHPRIGYTFAHWVSKKGEHYKHSTEYNQRVCDEMKISAQTRIDQGFDYFITGHYHQAKEIPVNGGKMMILGDWLHYFSYGYFDGKELTLKYWEQDASQ